MSFVAGKNILITGATGGIGEALALQLSALKPATIFVAARSADKGKAAVEAFKAAGAADAVVVMGDLSSKAGVNSIISGVRESGKPLHILIANAGAWNTRDEGRVTTKDGLEFHFQTNFLSCVQLMKGLMNLLEKSGPSRVIVTGGYGVIDPKLIPVEGLMQTGMDDLQFEKSKVTSGLGPNKFNNDLSYGQSKLLELMYLKKYITESPKKVTIIVWDPGATASNIGAWPILKEKMGTVAVSMLQFVLGVRAATTSCKVGVWCCDSPEAANAHGTYVEWGVSGALKKNVPVPLGWFPSYFKYAPAAMDDDKVNEVYKKANAML